MNYNNPSLANHQNQNYSLPPLNQQNFNLLKPANNKSYNQLASADFFFFDFTRWSLGQQVFDVLTSIQGENPNINLLNNEPVNVQFLNLHPHWTQTNKNARMSHKDYPQVGMVLNPCHPLSPLNQSNPLMTSKNPKVFFCFLESDYTIETVLNTYEMVAPFYVNGCDKMAFLARTRTDSINVERREYFEKDYYVIDWCPGPLFINSLMEVMTRIKVEACGNASKFWNQLKYSCPYEI